MTIDRFDSETILVLLRQSRHHRYFSFNKTIEKRTAGRFSWKNWWMRAHPPNCVTLEKVQQLHISVKRAFVIVGTFIDSDMPVSAVHRCGFNSNRGV